MNGNIKKQTFTMIKSVIVGVCLLCFCGCVTRNDDVVIVGKNGNCFPSVICASDSFTVVRVIGGFDDGIVCEVYGSMGSVGETIRIRSSVW